MSKKINEVFEEHLKNLVIDKALYDQIHKFRILWTQKDSDYIDFLGGNLTGVHAVRFSSLDEDKFFIDILNVDRDSLRYDLHKAEGIDKNMKVASNVTYLTIYYLMHKFATSKLSTEMKKEALKELYFIFAYKVITSLISYYFKYNVDVGTAKVVYEHLSNRFLIKRLGTWQKVFEYRTKDVLPTDGIHYHRILTCNADNATRMIADLQGKIRGYIKTIFIVLLDVNENNQKIVSTSMLVEDEEGVGIKNVVSVDIGLISYTRSILNKPNDFVNDDLVYLVQGLLPNLAPDKFIETLKYLSTNVQVKPGDPDDFIEVSIVATLNYLRTKDITSDYNKHAYEILNLMKRYWSSSSVKDADIKHIKKYLYDIAGKATGLKTKWLLATITIGVLMYVFIRALYRIK